jgi:general secretion pathway protein A
MYESFYKLRELPFTLTPDPAFLYYSPQHKFALTMLRYGLVSRAGF